MRKPALRSTAVYLTGIAGFCAASLAVMLLESAIAAGPPQYCVAHTPVTLKDGVHQTCHFLAVCYKAANIGFFVSIALVVIGGVTRASEQTAPDEP